MKLKFIDQNFKYDGSQLRSLFAFLDHGVQGDSIISWVGPCDIPKDKIVDGQDLLEDSIIYSEKMLHFVVELFDVKLIQMVFLQRLFCEIIREEIFKFSQGKVYLTRIGDDLYLKQLNETFERPEKNKDLKLNISIATVSPISGLMHFGINISSKNTPVKTYSLEDLTQMFGKKCLPEEWAFRLSARIAEEYESSKNATQKVKWVK